jgi:hypothetical protein
MMVADICLSLSRKKEDKVLGTGRIHVMKNRYGMDGMTYDAKVDTNNGHIEILGSTILDDNNERPKGGYREVAHRFFQLEGQSS